MFRSRSQMRRINAQVRQELDDMVDVPLLISELAMANGHIEHLRAEVERLQAEVKSLKPKRLTRNAAECHNCNTIIESKHRHDWVQCNCVPPDNGIYVDGGLEYQRRGAGLNACYTDLSTWE